MPEIPDAGFTSLYREQVDRLTRIAYLVCGDPEAAADAVSAVVSRALPRWRAGRISDAPAYLRRAVLNELFGGFRRRRSEAQRTHSAESAGVDAGFADQVVARDALWRALLALPTGQRAVLVLRFYEDLTETEAAAALGISVGTVESRVARASTRLRVLLTEEPTDA